ncbi:MAG: radical SAM protein [Oligoflexales bacterium]|nr:radical SAM protein [Oligoflexales bacterium]
MLDRFDRKIDYLRISVTDRCNLRCRYCMPEEGVLLFNKKEILTYEQIHDFSKVAAGLGIRKIRITGGEPLIRKNITDLIAKLSSINGIEDLSMTTNGTLLCHMAGKLKDAGLRRINISLDTMDREKYSHITRGGEIEHAIKGIESSVKAGLVPIKINCVVKNNSQEQDALSVKDFAEKNGLQIRFIKMMDLEKGSFGKVEGGGGGDCARCNRLRLTSNGFLKPCLFSSIKYDIRKIGYENALKQAIDNKPACGIATTGESFYNIGG